MRQEPPPKELIVWYAKQMLSILNHNFENSEEVPCFDIQGLKEDLQVISRRDIQDYKGSACKAIEASFSTMR